MTPAARPGPRFTAYAIALVVTIVTLLARWSMSSWVGGRPVLVLFLIPIIVSAHVGGLGPGLLSTLLVALGTSYFLLEPGHAFFIGKPLDFAQWAILVGTGVLVSALNEELRRARRRDASTIEQLREAQALLKTSMAALADSERRFRALSEHSADGIAVVDAQNNILYLSPAVSAVEGYTPEELM